MKTEHRSKKTTDNHQQNLVSIVRNKKTTSTVIALAWKQELAAHSGRETTAACPQHRAAVRAAVRSA
jgi:phosphoribosyl-AMP cyclohydrolase